MPKISIYVPDDMKARMDAAEDRANWSATAQRAFDTELDHLEAIKEVRSMTDVVERLQASKKRVAGERAAEGRTVGREWAKHEAEYDQLSLVAMLDTEIFDQSAGGFPGNSGWSAAEFVWQHIMGDDDSRLNDHDVEDLFGIEKDLQDRILTLEFVAAFVEGAAEVWEEIRDKL